jgi:hypothetical protein
MYEVRILPTLKQWCLDFDLESSLISATIRHPEIQQHFAPSTNLREPSLVSIFIRYFKTRWPFKDFYLLVVGNRDKLVLNINQAWRLYPSLLDIRGCANLVEVLERFADAYGADVTWEGKTAKFFLAAGTPLPRIMRLTFQGRPGRTIAIARAVQHREGTMTAALAVCIDLTKYLDMLRKMQVRPQEIETELSALRLGERFY